MKEAFMGTSKLSLENVRDVPNLTQVTDMSWMFNGSSITTVNHMNDWDVSNVENMDILFTLASDFNQNISGWDVSEVTTMREMFWGAKVFNQDISGWSVSSVENMALMFALAETFNQDISDWDVSSVKNMTAIFFEAKAFDQNLGEWKLNSLSHNSEIDDLDAEDNLKNDISFKGSGMHCNNVSLTLHGWAANTNLNNNIVVDISDKEYSPQIAAQYYKLTNDYGWVINHDGEAGEDSGCLDPLPVILIEFNANLRNGSVVLDWTTTMEELFDGFIVERSVDGKAWQELSYHKAQSSDATSDQYSRYMSIDKEPVKGINYYRLKQLDMDGYYEYSMVRSVKVTSQDKFTVFPNPSNGNIFITGLEGNAMVQVKDMSGRVLMQSELSLSGTSMNLLDISPGMYFLQFDTENGERLVERIIVY